jgi:hypothetical protein
MVGTRDGANEPETEVMAQTFDIRFARSGGIAAWFGAPANSFGWKGGGLLRIDANGLSIGLKRGIASLLARRRSQRIPAASIQEVYREGEALRVEFTTVENPRAVLPFWTRDRDTAARIVQLLPTSRTIELEDGADERRATAPRHTRLALAAALVLSAALGALFLNDQRPAPATPPAARAARSVPPVESGSVPGVAHSAPESSTASARESLPLSDRFTTPDEARKLALLAEDPVDWTVPPPSSGSAAMEAAARNARVARIELSGDPEVEGFVPMEIPEIQVPAEVVPIKQTTLVYDTARALLDAFEAEAVSLAGGFRYSRDHCAASELDARAFANRLDALEIRWRGLGDGMLQERKYADPALTGLRATLLSVVVFQRAFLTGYAAGLRAGDQARMDRAFKDLDRAVEALARARQYLN